MSIVIVNYNLTRELFDCIASLHRHLSSINYEIIVIDNNSIEPMFENFKSNYNRMPFVTLRSLDENIGFGRACNLGIEMSSGEFICFLNPDASIKEDIFTPMLECFRTDETLAILGPRINEARFLDFSAGFQPNLIIEMLNIIYVGRYLEAFLIFILAKVRLNRPFEVGWVLGACMVVRKSLAEKLSGFDPDYFMFYEEVDMCMRARSLGYKTRYLDSVSAQHIGSVSAKRDYSSFTRRFYNSKSILIEKHFRGLKRTVMKTIIKAQSVSQLILWTLLLPVYGEKSRQKVVAHSQLLRGIAEIS